MAAALMLGACNRGPHKPEQRPSASPRAVAPQRPAAPGQAVTPMADRVAVLGILNKRNGIVKEVALRPGQSARWKDLLVRLRACETTAPWEDEKLTGAFVQVDVQRSDQKLSRVFSGWLYKESPSLNVVEHPIYDVWPKSCAMTFPAGPPAPGAPPGASNRSSAAKSGGASPRGPAPRTAASAGPPTT
ncbi:MAG: DUF2155 domain-containing protein, partial [Sphingomicrobium sp.]